MIEWLEFFNAYRAFAQHITGLLLAAAMWRWGGSPERWLATIFVGTMVAPVYISRWLGLGEFGVGPFSSYYAMIDVAATILFVTVALHANRNYPLWIAGFQLVALGAHLVKAVPNTSSTLAIAILVIGPSYCQLLLLMGGFIRHLRRERRFGPYREWRTSPPFAGGLSL
jgi:predicted membrane protein